MTDRVQLYQFLAKRERHARRIICSCCDQPKPFYLIYADRRCASCAHPKQTIVTERIPFDALAEQRATQIKLASIPQVPETAMVEYGEYKYDLEIF